MTSSSASMCLLGFESMDGLERNVSSIQDLSQLCALLERVRNLPFSMEKLRALDVLETRRIQLEEEEKILKEMLDEELFRRFCEENDFDSDISDEEVENMHADLLVQEDLR